MSTPTARRLLAATLAIIAAFASSPSSIGARTRPRADRPDEALRAVLRQDPATIMSAFKPKRSSDSFVASRS